jgi:hypothetical protein
MTISYAITVCNEFEEIKRLLNLLFKYKTPKDEICVLVDRPKASESLLNYLRDLTPQEYILLLESEFNNDFSEWKNKLNRVCSKDYIFQLDADEYPCDLTLQHIGTALESNSKVDLLNISRINTVEGITIEKLREWKWTVRFGTSYGDLINYPDYQGRIYRNSKDIYWTGKVHEKLTGYSVVGNLPETFKLFHPKTFERQVRQNEFYESL